MIEEKLSMLTEIPTSTIKKIGRCVNYIHSQDVAIKIKENSDTYSGQVIELDTFEGKIYLQLKDDIIEYKFVPDKEFENIIKNTILTKESILLKDITKSIKNTLKGVYKDLF